VAHALGNAEKFSVSERPTVSVKPLKIAIGIELSWATGFAEGFGILALASAYPVINILLLGLFVNRRQRQPKTVGPAAHSGG